MLDIDLSKDFEYGIRMDIHPRWSPEDKYLYVEEMIVKKERMFEPSLTAIGSLGRGRGKRKNSKQ